MSIETKTGLLARNVNIGGTPQSLIGRPQPASFRNGISKAKNSFAI